MALTLASPTPSGFRSVRSRSLNGTERSSLWATTPVPSPALLNLVLADKGRRLGLADLPYLEREDIAEALRFAAEAVRERELPLLPSPA